VLYRYIEVSKVLEISQSFLERFPFPETSSFLPPDRKSVRFVRNLDRVRIIPNYSPLGLGATWLKIYRRCAKCADTRTKLPRMGKTRSSIPRQSIPAGKPKRREIRAEAESVGGRASFDSLEDGWRLARESGPLEHTWACTGRRGNYRPGGATGGRRTGNFRGRETPARPINAI